MELEAAMVVFIVLFGLPIATDTVGEFVLDVWRPRIRLPGTPHLAHLPTKRPTAGICQQYPLLSEALPEKISVDDSMASATKA
jgi:hypothetical protein